MECSLSCGSDGHGCIDAKPVDGRSEPWEYSQTFDYIHTRTTAGCWASFETQIAKQAFEALNPGGYFESQEFDSVVACDDGTMPEGSAIATWFHDMARAGQINDRPTVLGRHLKEIYQRVGFVDVEERVFKMPTNSWPKDRDLKELGRMWESNFMQGLSGFSFSMFNRAFGRTPTQIEASLPLADWSCRALIANSSPIGITSRRATRIL